MHVARVAARMLYERTESEYLPAKLKAARQVGADPRSKNLPSNAEVREELRALADLYEGEGRYINLRAMRKAALEIMRLLVRFRPYLIGSVCTGHIRQGSDIDVHVFSDSIASVTMVLDDAWYAYEVERKRVLKFGEESIFTHIHVDQGDFPVELTVYGTDKIGYVFKSSITGKPMEKMTIRDLEMEEFPGPSDRAHEGPDVGHALPDLGDAEEHEGGNDGQVDGQQDADPYG